MTTLLPYDMMIFEVMNSMPDESSTTVSDEELTDEKQESTSAPQVSKWGAAWEKIVRLGLGEITLRIGTALASIAMILLVIWVMGNFYLSGAEAKPASAQEVKATPTGVLPTVTAVVKAPVYQPQATGAYLNGVVRLADLHTILPNRPRFEVVQYEVVQGDAVFSIAEKFNLHPATILFGNKEILADNPHYLQPGQLLNILPVDGVYHKWSEGENLVKVAEYYGVTAEDVINWPGNHLDIKTIADIAHPPVEPGTMLMIPGGTRAFVSWSAPFVERSNPAVASIYGPGVCGPSDGAVGSGPPFTWPTTETWLSGYDYSPETNHWGIDIAGTTGNPIYAVDDGVVVYAGEHFGGYGYVVMIDHGRGWQSLYAHLSAIYVSCGQSVARGATIGAMGSTGRSTGPHLHFEIRGASLGRANPWDWLIH